MGVLSQQRDISGTKPIVLASASPRRQELLVEAGVAFDVVPSRVPEVPRAGEEPVAYALRMASEKASKVARRCPDRWILAADTIVMIDGQTLGKPRDERHAGEMLRLLSGRAHNVVTAFVVLCPGGRISARQVVVTVVRFRLLSERVIEEYVAGGEPFGKAGGYAIQGAGSRLVERYEGSYSNVVGLPVDEVKAALREACK